MVSNRIKGITIEIGGDATKLQNALRDVDKQLSTTQSNLRDINKLLQIDPGNTELLTQKQKNLRDAVSETKDRLAELNKAQSNLKEGTPEWDALQREIVDTEQKLKSAKKQLDDFGTVTAQKVKVAGEKVKEAGSKISDVGGQLSRVTAPLVTIGTSGVQSFAEVDKTMQLTYKTMNTTEDEAKLLNQAMKDAAANSTFGMNDAATASLNFARAGLDAREAAAALAPAMNLAAGEGGNLDMVSAGLVGTINGFGDSFDNTVHYADVFAAACNNSALDVDSLSHSMGVAAPVFKTAGRDVEDAALALGIMANANIDADKASNALKTGVMRLAAPTKQAAEAMEQYGIETSAVWTDGGKMKSVLEIQKNLHDSFAGLTEQEALAAASAIFGKNQGAAWLALINTAPADVQELSDSIHSCSGLTQEMADAMMSGFGGSLEKIKSSIDVAVTSLGEALAPTIQKVADAIQKAVDWFNSLDEEQQKNIATIGLVVAAAGPALIVVGHVVSAIGTVISTAGSLIGIFPKVAAAFTAVQGEISGLSMVITAGGGLIPTIGNLISAAAPFLVGGAIVAGVIAGGVLIYKHWDDIKAGAKELGKRISDTWQDIQKTISKKWEEVKKNTADSWKNMQSTISTKWNEIKSNTSTRLQEIRATASNKWQEISQNTSTRLNEIRNTVNSRWNELRQNTSTAFSNIGSYISNKWAEIRNNTASTLGSMGSSVAGSLSGMMSNFSTALSNIYNNASYIWNNIRSVVSNGVQALRNMMQFEWRLPHIPLPHFRINGRISLNPPQMPSISVDWYKKAYENAVLFKHPTVLQTPYGAKGFGDGAGAEVVMGLNKLQELVGHGGVTNNITIYAAEGQSEQQIADIVIRKITRAEQRAAIGAI